MNDVLTSAGLAPASTCACRSCAPIMASAASRTRQTRDDLGRGRHRQVPRPAAGDPQQTKWPVDGLLSAGTLRRMSRASWGAVRVPARRASCMGPASGRG